MAGAVWAGERETVTERPTVEGAVLRTPCRDCGLRWTKAALPEETGAREATVLGRVEPEAELAMGERPRWLAPLHQWVAVPVATTGLRCPAPLNDCVLLFDCVILLAIAVEERSEGSRRFH